MLHTGRKALCPPDVCLNPLSVALLVLLLPAWQVWTNKHSRLQPEYLEHTCANTEIDFKKDLAAAS